MANNKPPTHLSMGQSFTVQSGAAPAAPHEVQARAEAALRAGRLAEAERLLKGLLDSEPRNAGAWHLMGLVALRAGNQAAAEKLLNRAIATDNRNPDYHATLGSILLGLDRKEDGEATLRNALALKPSHAMANYNLGLLLLQQGHVEDAGHCLDKAVKAQPRNPDMLNALGVALAKADKHQKAAQMFARVLKLVPGHGQARFNRANALTEAGEPGKALPEYEALLEEHPQDADLHFNHAGALVAAQKLAAAIKAYRTAIDIDPDSAGAHNNLGNLLKDRGFFEEATTHLEKARNLRPNDSPVLKNLAECYLNNRNGVKAIEMATAFLERVPDNPEVLGVRFRALRNEGRFDEAGEQLKEAWQRNPGSSELLLLRASLEETVLDDAQINQIHEFAEDESRTVTTRTIAWFRLGDIHRKRAEPERAFICYDRGNRLKDHEFDGAAFGRATEELDAIRGVFTPELFASKSGMGSDSSRPIFIVGMPRSGSTLVEQIFVSHPDVAGGGELEHMGRIARELGETTGSAADFPDSAAETDAGVLRTLASEYLAKLEAISPTARSVTDKMPGNFRLLGLIALLYPRAHIIHCRRTPEATGLSIFFHNFGGFHSYAYDLRKLGDYYRRYRRLMEHWRAVLPLPMLEMDYEDLVDNQEAASRRLLEFCNLPWDDGVLRFHETKRTVQTASLWQVRQPLYRSGLDYWKAYETFLEPFVRGLEGKAG